MKSIPSAAIGGLVAAVPMLVVMDLLNHLLPGHSKEHRLPPMKITTRVAKMAGGTRHVSNPSENVGGFFAHLGFGAIMGAIYGALVRKGVPASMVTGAGFGLFVWVASYAGWLPLNGILPPPQRRPLRPNTTIVLAHLAWGTLLGLATWKAGEWEKGQ